jgi:hypothetical protein
MTKNNKHQVDQQNKVKHDQNKRLELLQEHDNSSLISILSQIDSKNKKKK